jgi:16S rRNA (uracil1498-N3)-methyltransferase
LHRFFLPPEAVQSSAVYFPMEFSRQIATVLHLRAGERVLVLDGRGAEYVVELEIVAPRSTQGRVLESRPAGGEPRARLWLYLSLTQREKFEWMLQKCTEVGAAGFTPVVTERSLVQSTEDAPARRDRWQRILREAAEQCGRGRVPELYAPLRWEEALVDLQKRRLPGLMAWEEEHTAGLRAALQALPPNPQVPALALFTGPEGGYSAAEAAQARAAGLRTFTLGKRILRMETAAVVAAALVLHELDEI